MQGHLEMGVPLVSSPVNNSPREGCVHERATLLTAVMVREHQSMRRVIYSRSESSSSSSGRWPGVLGINVDVVELLMSDISDTNL